MRTKGRGQAMGPVKRYGFQAGGQMMKQAAAKAAQYSKGKNGGFQTGQAVTVQNPNAVAPIPPGNTQPWQYGLANLNL